MLCVRLVVGSALLASCVACGFGSTYADCLHSRLDVAHTAEAVSLIAQACREEYPERKDATAGEHVLSDVYLTGRASVLSRYGGEGPKFVGSLYNPSTTETVTSVVVSLSVSKAAVASFASSAPISTPPLSYRVPVIIGPQSVASFSVPILDDENYGSDWNVREVRGLGSRAP